MAAAYTIISVGNTCSEGVSSTTKLELELSSCSCYAAHAFVLRLILMISGFVAHFPIECCELNVLEKGVIGGLNSFGSLVLLSGWWNVPRHVMLALAWHDVTQRGLNQPCQHDLSCLVVSYTCFSQCPFLYWNDDPQLFESFWRCSGGSTSPILAPKP